MRSQIARMATLSPTISDARSCSRCDAIESPTPWTNAGNVNARQSRRWCVGAAQLGPKIGRYGIARERVRTSADGIVWVYRRSDITVGKSLAGCGDRPGACAPRPTNTERGAVPPSPPLRLFLARSDAIALEDRQHEHAPLADLSGARRLPHGFHDIVGHVVGDDDFDLHFWQQADVVFLATIDGGVSLLLAVAANLGHCHSRDVQLGERILDLIDLIRTNDALDQFHSEPSSVRRRSEVSACCSASVSLEPPLVMWKTSIAFSPSVAISTRSTSHP